MNYFKVILFSLSAATIFYSCGESTVNSTSSDDSVESANDAASTSFSIKGKISEGEDKVVLLEELKRNEKLEVAQATISKNGKFSIEGDIQHLGIYQLSIVGASGKAIPLTLTPNDKIELNTSFEQFEKTPNVSGSTWGETMTKYMKVYDSFRTGQEALMTSSSELPQDVLMEKYQELMKPIEEFASSEMKAAPSNPFNVILSGALSPNAGYKSWNPENLDILESVQQAFKEDHPDAPLTALLESQVSQIRAGYTDYKANNSGERTAPEIALKDPNGKLITLSSLKGKYVLIDFWASWCGPCRKENPNVVRLYNKYKDDGFTVLSVSLDKDADAWKRAIMKDGLIWPNHVSDLKQWESPMVSLYGFSGIPYTVLVNKEGKIIGTGLRGSSLEQKLEDIFSK